MVAGGVKFFPTISKKVTIKGFGGFSEPVADSFDIVGRDILPVILNAQLGLPIDSLAFSFWVAVTLSNSSDISLSLSRLDTELILGDLSIGHLAVQDLNLVRGWASKLMATGHVYGIHDI